jgi:hypothetical protein
MHILKWLLPFLILASAASAQLMMTGYGHNGGNGGGGGGCAGVIDASVGCPLPMLGS